MENFSPIKRVQFCEDTLWQVYMEIVHTHEPLNLGTYHPDSVPYKLITDSLKDVLNSSDPDLHQYTKSSGHPRLVNVLSKIYSQLLNRNVDPQTEVMTTLGGSEGLNCCVMGLVEDGDEVIAIEPFFNSYLDLVEVAGGKLKLVTLRQRLDAGDHPTAADWVLDAQELENAFSNKTKAIILNTPTNPIGKVFDLSELTLIADLCKKWNVICIADEVYEWMVYKPKEHIRIASLPGMWERTVTLGSAGKSFSITGWKVGWLYGGAKLIDSLKTIHLTTVFTGSTPLEETIARVLEKELPHLGEENSYFANVQKDLKAKRDCIVDILKKAKLKPVIPEAGAFLIADWSELEPLADLDSETDEYKDFRFTKWLAKNVGILGIPITPYYRPENKKGVEKYVRICFVANKKYLEKAGPILEKFVK